MREFWIVCTWSTYYPGADIQNIVLVTFDENEAFEERSKIMSHKEWVEDIDNCEVFHSSKLPWSHK